MSSLPVIPNDDQETKSSDNSYVNQRGQQKEPIAVQSDSAPVEDPIDANTADSDAQLDGDEKEAIDKSNIIGGGKTRGAKPTGTYQEPGDEEGLPGPEDGTSATR